MHSGLILLLKILRQAKPSGLGLKDGSGVFFEDRGQIALSLVVTCTIMNLLGQCDSECWVGILYIFYEVVVYLLIDFPLVSIADLAVGAGLRDSHKGVQDRSVVNAPSVG